jgi:hypothetical protein
LRFGLFRRQHGRDEPIAAFGDRLDDARLLARVSEQLAQLRDRPGQALVAAKLDAPDAVDDLVSRKRFALPLGEQAKRRP